MPNVLNSTIDFEVAERIHEVNDLFCRCFKRSTLTQLPAFFDPIIFPIISEEVPHG